MALHNSMATQLIWPYDNIASVASQYHWNEASRQHNIMTSHHPCCTASYHHSIIAMEHHGIMASWHNGWHHGIMASWYHGGEFLKVLKSSFSLLNLFSRSAENIFLHFKVTWLRVPGFQKNRFVTSFHSHDDQDSLISSHLTCYLNWTCLNLIPLLPWTMLRL